MFYIIITCVEGEKPFLSDSRQCNHDQESKEFSNIYKTYLCGLCNKKFKSKKRCVMHAEWHLIGLF